MTSASKTRAPSMFSPSVLPLTVRHDRSSRSRMTSSTAIRPPAKWRSSIRCLPAGIRLQITGTSSLASANESSESSWPKRRAIAIRWISELVDPEIAMSATTAFFSAAGVTMSDGFRSSHTISTIRRPASDAIRPCSASTAGIVLALGSDRPSTSMSSAIVDAVPIVLQVPVERALASDICIHSRWLILPAR